MMSRASLPENVKADIASEVRRLQMVMDRYWPDAMADDKKAAELWRKLGVDLRILTGWQAPASAGFHLSVNVAQVTSGSAARPTLEQSNRTGEPSASCSTASPPQNAQTTSKTQDMLQPNQIAL
jgi:hypothetical protein